MTPVRPSFAPNEHILNQGGSLIYGPEIQIAVKESAVTVGVTATKLPSTPLQYRRSIIIFNNGTAAIYLGSASVTTATGMVLQPQSFIVFPINDQIDLYAISSAGQDVRLLEAG